jgi:membrane fusion protein (multidrug efflux system)
VHLRRITELSDNKNATPGEAREAEAELRVAEARLRAAKHALSLTQVISPFDGVLSEVAARPGMLVGNKPVATLVEISAPSVSVHVPQHLINKLKTGQAATVFVYPLPEDTFTGHVSVISPVMKAGSGTVVITVRLDDPAGKVRPGMQAQVQFEGI